MSTERTRREFVRDLGLSAAAVPFLLNLPSLGIAAEAAKSRRKQRLVVLFSPNGIVPWNFWPDETGEKFTLNGFLKVCPRLDEYKNITLKRRLNIRDPKRDTLDDLGETLYESRVWVLDW